MGYVYVHKPKKKKKKKRHTPSPRRNLEDLGLSTSRAMTRLIRMGVPLKRQPVLSMMVLFYVLKESVVSFLVEVRRDDSLVIQGVSSSALKHIRKK